MVSYALVAVGTIALGIYLMRKWNSRKWGRVRKELRNKKLNGKVVIVTGGNAGLGAEVVKDMAGRGATVVMTGRDEAAAQKIIDKAAAKNQEVHFLHLDLASLESIRSAAAELAEKFPKIDALVLNAGVWVPMEKKWKTKDGLEIHAGVNHLGHFLLTNLLMDNLRSSVPCRVVSVSSGLMNMAKLDFDKYDHFYEGRPSDDPSLSEEEEKKKKRTSFAPTGYCDSKMMNGLFARNLSERMSGTGIMAVAVCPGFCFTSLARHTDYPTWKKVLLAPLFFMIMRSAARGAENIIQAVLEEDEELVPGGFYRECKIAPEENAKLEGLGDVGIRLWDISESLTAK